MSETESLMTGTLPFNMKMIVVCFISWFLEPKGDQAQGQSLTRFTEKSALLLDRSVLDPSEKLCIDNVVDEDPVKLESLI